MPTEEAKRIINQAIKNPEFIKELSSGFDLFPCIEAICSFEYAYGLEALRHVLDNRIDELYIRDWFVRINKVIS